jgi:hypothetical protein
MTKNFNIFQDQTKDMPSYDERPARSSVDMDDTRLKARLPGMEKVPGRGIESPSRPRRGHDY